MPISFQPSLVGEHQPSSKGQGFASVFYTYFLKDAMASLSGALGSLRRNPYRSVGHRPDSIPYEAMPGPNWHCDQRGEPEGGKGDKTGPSPTRLNLTPQAAIAVAPYHEPGPFEPSQKPRNPM
jgi:hypothetical protein